MARRLKSQITAPGARRVSLGSVILGLLLFVVSGVALGQENADCLSCHEDSEATGTRRGKEISVYVDPAAFARSVHSAFACIDCHTDLEGAELPHAEDLQPVDCASCHDDVAEEHSQGPHGKWPKVPGSPSAACERCHGVHDVLSPKAPDSPVNRSRVDDLCGKCHIRELTAVKTSPHIGGGTGAPAASCVDCHRGHSVTAPADPIRQLDTCGTCHAAQAKAHRRSLHGRAAVKGDPLAPSCVTCHGNHAILRHTDEKAPTYVTNIPLLCGRCHREGTAVTKQYDIPQDRILENFSMSVHGQGLYKKGLTVTAVCTSCHTSHDILDHNNPDSSINRANVAKTCMQCHARIEQVHVKVIEGRLWEKEPHKIPSCVECHQPHKIRARSVESVGGAANRDCMRCHGKQDLTMVRSGETISLYVDAEAYDLSTHARVACAQCHNEVTVNHPERACATITHKVDCSICHAEQVQEHELSKHGRLAAAGDTQVPTCLTCHEKHATQSHRLPTARTFSRNIPELCGQCHAAGGVAAARITADVPDIVESYLKSAHGKGLMESGLVVSASCIDCHTAHKALPPDDPNSSVNRDNLADTCGACHKGIEEQFKTSIHWPGNVVTTKQLPVCEDCHTSHSIGRVDTSDFRFAMMNQCGRCHEDYAKTFFETYHGKVTQLGSPGAAKCYDCHGTHNILPVEDPNSTLSRRNVVDTCAKCHPGAHRQFAGYLTHATHHEPDKYPFLFYSFWFMTILLVGTLTFFLFHTFLWLFRLWRTRDQWRVHKSGKAERYYMRFTRKQRAMHLVMLLSFFTLALTGMTLKFSYMTWAHGLSRALGGFDTMGTLHRIGAITLMALFVYHIRDVFRAKGASGKSWFKFIFGTSSLMFNLDDVKQFWKSAKWFIGRGPRPEYGRFTYWEKFDYFAVFWGVFVIGSTGLLLWFPEFFTRFLPGWAINVATIIHSDEALLAVGFIFTIHFFNTHFRPDKFPMDPVIFTGRVSLEELRHDKPAEYEEFVEQASEEERAKRVVGPAPPKAERLFRIFGFTALGVGLTLIFLILYAMLFGYR